MEWRLCIVAILMKECVTMLNAFSVRLWVLLRVEKLWCTCKLTYCQTCSSAFCHNTFHYKEMFEVMFHSFIGVVKVGENLRSGCERWRARRKKMFHSALIAPLRNHAQERNVRMTNTGLVEKLPHGYSRNSHNCHSHNFHTDNHNSWTLIGCSAVRAAGPNQ